MRPLENSLASLQLNARSSAPTSPIEGRRYNNNKTNISYSEMAASSRNLMTDNCNLMQRATSSFSTPNVQQTSLLQQMQQPLTTSKITEDLTQLQAIHILHKMRNGEVSLISRSDIVRLNNLINTDNRIFAKVDMIDGVCILDFNIV